MLKLFAAAVVAIAVATIHPAGAILLTDAKARNGGITPGDTPDYPITRLNNTRGGI